MKAAALTLAALAAVAALMVRWLVLVDRGAHFSLEAQFNPARPNDGGGLSALGSMGFDHADDDDDDMGEDE